MYPVVHKSKIKTKKLANWKKKINIYLNATGLKPTSFECLTQDYPLGYRGIMINFIQISNDRTISSTLFTKIHEDWVKGHCIFICLGSILTNNTGKCIYWKHVVVAQHRWAFKTDICWRLNNHISFISLHIFWIVFKEQWFNILSLRLYCYIYWKFIRLYEHQQET